MVKGIILLQMTSALANRAIGAIVGTIVADAAGNHTKVHSFCTSAFKMSEMMKYLEGAEELFCGFSMIF